MDMFFDLQVEWMALVVIFALALANLLTYLAVARIAAKRAATLKAMTPVMLTPLAVIFGLIVGFLSAQVWRDAENAQAAVMREAAALSTVVLLASGMPSEVEASMRSLVRRHIHEAVQTEWPAMARQETTLPLVSLTDQEALRLALAFAPRNEAQTIAQREIVAAMRSAIDAREERIVVSRSKINWVKWTVVLVLAYVLLVGIAIIHSDNRSTAAIAMGLYSVAVAACLILVASHNRPFTGEISVDPGLLVRVLPGE